MADSDRNDDYKSAREKFLALSLGSTRKSYYPQLQEQLELAKQNERRLQLLVDHIPARVAYVDSEQHYVLVNREYEKVFGLSEKFIVYCRW